MTSSDDGTEAAGRRHRSSEPRISRWRRRQDKDVEQFDPDDMAKVLRRAADEDRQRQGDMASSPTQIDPERDTGNKRAISDALVQGLADPSPAGDRKHVLPRRRSDRETPAVPVDRPENQRRATSEQGSLEARLLAAEDHDERAHPLASERDDVEGRVRTLTEAAAAAAEERATLEQLVSDQARMLEEARADRASVQDLNERHAEQIQQLQADLQQAEQRARTLATESAARATEHSERVRALVAEREAAEERARALSEEVSGGAGDQDAVNERSTRERAALEQALAQAVRLADEARTSKAKADAEIAALRARLAQAGAEPHPADDRLVGLEAALAAAEERIRALTEDAAERTTQHTERVDILLTDVEAAEHVAQEARRVAQQSEARMFEARAEVQLAVEQRTAAVSEAHQALAEAHALASEQTQARLEAEARVESLERQLGEAHVLPVFSPVARPAEVTAPEPEPEAVVVPAEEPEEPEDEIAPEPEAVVVPAEEPEEPEDEIAPEPEPEAVVVPAEEPEEPEDEIAPEPEPVPEAEAYDWSEPVEYEDVEEETPEPEPDPWPIAAAGSTAARAPSTTYDAKHGAGLIGPAAGVVALACGAAVGWMAYQATVMDYLAISLILTAIALLGLAVALRQRSQTSEVHIERGTLRLRFGDQHHTFYLNSPSTELAMTGQPGDRDWQIQVLRKGRPPVSIDHKDVDPVTFTETLRHWRPDL